MTLTRNKDGELWNDEDGRVYNEDGTLRREGTLQRDSRGRLVYPEPASDEEVRQALGTSEPAAEPEPDDPLVPGV